MPAGYVHIYSPSMLEVSITVCSHQLQTFLTNCSKTSYSHNVSCWSPLPLQKAGLSVYLSALPDFQVRAFCPSKPPDHSTAATKGDALERLYFPEPHTHAKGRLPHPKRRYCSCLSPPARRCARPHQRFHMQPSSCNWSPVNWPSKQNAQKFEARMPQQE